MHRASVLCVGLLTWLAFSSPTAHGTGTARRVVLVSQCGAIGVQRPTELVMFCGDAGLRVHRLRWSAWGGRVAIARGVQMTNDCVPFCAAGHFHSTSVVMHLYTRRPCHGRTHLYYLNATIIPLHGPRAGYLVRCAEPPATAP